MTHCFRGFFSVAIVATALFAAGITLADAYPQAASTSATPAPYNVAIKDFAFSPAVLKVPVGATVVWKNQDSAAHTATANDKTFDSGNLDNGKSFSFTFTKSGTFNYVCSYHPNMTASIVVGDAKPQASAAPTAPPAPSGY